MSDKKYQISKPDIHIWINSTVKLCLFLRVGAVRQVNKSSHFLSGLAAGGGGVADQEQQCV